MKFWDSSAIVPLLINEEDTEYCIKVVADDPRMLIWCLSRVEVVSAMCRRVRDGLIGAEEFEKAKQRLASIMSRADARSQRLIECVRGPYGFWRFILCGLLARVNWGLPWWVPGKTPKD